MSDIQQKQEERLKVKYSECPPFPKTIFFDLNNHCNHKCFFCSNRKMSRKTMLPFALAERLLKEAYKEGTTDIGLYATGEPLLYPQLIEIIETAKKIGIPYIFFTTNGSLAVPEKMKMILKAGIDSIKFSINAGTRESYKKIHGKDDFDTVIDNITWCSNHIKNNNIDTKLYACMVKTSITENETDILTKILEPLVEDFQVRSCSNQGGNKIENNDTEKIDEKNLLGTLRESQEIEDCCPDPFGRATITPEGYMTACVVDYRNYLAVADLSKSSLKEAWLSEPFIKLRQKHLNKDLKGLVCYNCLNNVDLQVQPLIKKFAKPFKY